MKAKNSYQLVEELAQNGPVTEARALERVANRLDLVPAPAKRTKSARIKTLNTIMNTIAHAESGAETAPLPSPSTAKLRHGWPRWTLVPAGAFAALMVFVVSASGAALPGQPLYGLKLAKEDVLLALAPTAEAKARHCSVTMLARARELALLPAGQSPEKVASLVAAVKTEADEFSEYADRAGDQKDNLYELRSQTAVRAIAELNTARQNQQLASSQANISASIAFLNTLVQ